MGLRACKARTDKRNAPLGKIVAELKQKVVVNAAELSAGGSEQCIAAANGKRSPKRQQYIRMYTRGTQLGSASACPSSAGAPSANEPLQRSHVDYSATLDDFAEASSAAAAASNLKAVSPPYADVEANVEAG